MDRSYTLRTPENVEFHFILAGSSSRFLAWLIDIVIIIAVAVVLLIVFSIFASIAGGLASALFFIAFFLLRWGYFVFFEWIWRGQSIGKKALNLRVMQDRGVSITPLQSIIRNLLRIVDGLPLFYFVGGLTAFFHPGNKRLGDIVAGTMVVHIQQRKVPTTIIPPRERYNSFVEDKKVVATINRRITVSERELLVYLAVRRDSLPIEMRLSFYERLSEFFQKKLALSKPDYFSDERFVLNLTAVLLDARVTKRKGF